MTSASATRRPALLNTWNPAAIAGVGRAVFREIGIFAVCKVLIAVALAVIGLPGLTARRTGLLTSRRTGLLTSRRAGVLTSRRTARPGDFCTPATPVAREVVRRR